MKRYLFLVVAALCMASCEEVKEDILMDVPEIEFEESEITLGAEAVEEFIIPLLSTGVDEVSIHHMGSIYDNWDVDEESGDLTPKESWIEIVRVINEYDNPTRALRVWKSAVVVRIKANDTGRQRKAVITASSFTKSDQVTLIQSAQAEN